MNFIYSLHYITLMVMFIFKANNGFVNYTHWGFAAVFAVTFNAEPGGDWPATSMVSVVAITAEMKNRATSRCLRKIYSFWKKKIWLVWKGKPESTNICSVIVGQSTDNK